MWYGLEKPKKAKRQGLIKARLVFSAEKISEVAMQEHRHLLRILLLHELENSKVFTLWYLFLMRCSANNKFVLFLGGALLVVWKL